MEGDIGKEGWGCLDEGSLLSGLGMWDYFVSNEKTTVIKFFESFKDIL